MSENMNEKYQQYYNKLLTGTLTETLLKSISLQANVQLANDIIAEQEKTIQESKTGSDVIKKDLEAKESLNEHYVAGGIVGIGAINQIPSRTKEVYEDAFEYFCVLFYS